jgi:sugar phosphate isomerase/epimerase
MAQNVELLGSYWTLAGGAMPHTDKDYSPFDFKDRVEAAAKAGFKGIGIWHTDLAHTLKTRSLKEMRQILDYNGIKHFELEFLSGWFLDGEERKESDEWRKLLFTAAEALGARHVKVGHFVKDPAPMSRLIESFGALCSEAASHGTKILFELMPFGMIDTLTDTMTMIQGAGAKNGGVIFDLWHLVKLGISYDEVARVAGQCEVGVELNDGTFKCPWDLHEDTINHRRLCGEGEFDVKVFVAKMLKAGYNGPWGIEVLNAELRKLPLEEVVNRAFSTTMAQFPR